MIRRSPDQPLQPQAAPTLHRVRHALLTRRRFLICAAGGSVALLFANPGRAQDEPFDPWPTLDAVLQHLLPSEPDAPGAREINALAYLRFVVDDPKVDTDERRFILQGNQWLDQLARERHAAGFTDLDWDGREALLRDTAASAAGENWIATLLTYLFEALLSAPAYGGNPNGIGWRWLEYVPGFPLPTADTRFPALRA